MQATGDAGSIPTLGRTHGRGNACTQHSSLGNFMDRRPGEVQSMGSQSQTQLSMHNLLKFKQLETWKEMRN